MKTLAKNFGLAVGP